ncbi:MAG: DUF5689 domain-containing protein [Rikenellaceae bacterium]
MKKLINIALVALVAFATVSCYNDFGTPDPAYVYTDADFEQESTIISIKEFKDTYSGLVGTSTNKLITEDWVIRGKVISSDESGNLYKSLYIQDGSYEDGTRSGIELRLFSSNYVKYPEGSMVYVKLKGLSIGDYSGMISVGAYSYTLELEGETYTHTTIEGRTMLAEHIFLGEMGEIDPETDIVYIDKDNYSSITSDLLGCLIYFEGLESVFSEYNTVNWTTSSYAVYPSYFCNSTTYFNWSPELYESGDEFWENPPMAYQGVDPTVEGSTETNYYYGSAWYSFDKTSSSYTAQFIVRLSGYAKFKDTPVPANGTMMNIKAILTQYKSGSYNPTYQIVPCYLENFEYVEQEE